MYPPRVIPTLLPLIPSLALNNRHRASSRRHRTSNSRPRTSSNKRTLLPSLTADRCTMPPKLGVNGTLPLDLLLHPEDISNNHLPHHHLHLWSPVRCPRRLGDLRDSSQWDKRLWTRLTRALRVPITHALRRALRCQPCLHPLASMVHPRQEMPTFPRRDRLRTLFSLALARPAAVPKRMDPTLASPLLP